mgnify:CR=1 FL=1
MIEITIEATRRAIREQYFPIGPASDIFVNLNLLPDYESIKVGGPIKITFKVKEDIEEKKKKEEKEEQFSLQGHVSWKRPRDIKLPGRVMPAGIGVKLDQQSYDLVEDRIIKEQSELSDISFLMVGGNYIRVRHDIAKILRQKEEASSAGEKSKKKPEKRSVPRLALSMPVEVFINDQVSSLKMRDISLTGMAIETNEPLAIGDDIVIILEDRSVHKQFILKARVVRHIPHPDDSRRIIGVGVVFLFENAAQKRELMKFIVRHS